MYMTIRNWVIHIVSSDKRQGHENITAKNDGISSSVVSITLTSDS